MLERLDSRLYENGGFEIKEEPFYLPQGNEIALFEAAYENRLPVMLKGPTGSGKTKGSRIAQKYRKAFMPSMMLIKR